MQSPCRNFSANGTCRFGSKCQYLHGPNVGGAGVSGKVSATVGGSGGGKIGASGVGGGGGGSGGGGTSSPKISPESAIILKDREISLLNKMLERSREQARKF